MGYKPCIFRAECNGKPIYHTNVVMAVGAGFAVLCGDAITDAGERAEVEASLDVRAKLVSAALTIVI